MFGLLEPSCADEFKSLIFGTNPIEEAPVIASAQATPLPSLPPEPERADPRAIYKLPNGGEASYEYAEAKRLMSVGRLMAAGMILTSKALGETGTADELDLLIELCTRQEEEACVASATAKKKGLGGDLDSLRKLAKSSPENARTLLLPRLQSGELSAAEAEILAGACAKLRDKECEGMAKSRAKE